MKKNIFIIFVLLGLFILSSSAMAADNASCKKEGETFHGTEECCQGLKKINEKNNIGGSAAFFVCTAKCGNGACNTDTESNYNCPQDCPAKKKPICGDGICEGNENSASQQCTTAPDSVCFTVKNCAKDCKDPSNDIPVADKTGKEKILINKILQLIDQLKALILSLFSR